jgi:hypothetical protein
MEIKNKTKNSPAKPAAGPRPAKKGVAEGVRKLKREAKERTAGYILAALGLVAGLAWNDAVKTLIENFFPVGHGGIFPKFLYAIIITLLVVVAATYISRLLIKDEEEGQE